MKLIIAEKPSLGKNIASALQVKTRKNGYLESDDHIVSWAFGHLFKLKDIDEYLGEKKQWKDVSLPFFPDDFEFIIKNDPGVRKQFKLLKELINRKEVDEIIHCGDADREGQVIIDIILKYIGTSKRVSRLWLPEQTEESIRREMKQLKDNDDYVNLLNEGLTRTYMDWLLGINLTRHLTLKSGQLFPCGRVLIPIVKFIYDRDIAIKDFQEEKYYLLESKLNIDGRELILSIKDEKFKLGDLDKAEEKAKILNKSKAKVIEIEEKEVIKQPLKLFSLSKLQSKLSKEHKIPFASSLEIIQKLYEDGLITYPRTNTEYLAENEKDKVQKLIEQISEYSLEMKETKRIFDDSKIESHSAIIPTTKEPKNLSQNENLVYMTVFKRFIANFYKEDSIISSLNMKIAVDEEIFAFKGESVKREGFLKVEPQKIENNLPFLKEGQELEVNFLPVEKKTTPPRKVTEEEISNYLKNPFRKEINTSDENQDDNEEYKNILKGIEIGTEATRTGIIENAKRYKYISQTKQSFSILPLGISLIDLLDKLNINLYKEKTVEFSVLQKEVLKGEKTIDEVMTKIKDEITKVLSQDIKLEKLIKDSNKEIIGTCPRCRKNIYENDKAFYCKGYKDDPKCNFSLWKEDKFFIDKKKKLTKQMAVKLLKDGRVYVKDLYSKKTNKNYDATVVIVDTGKYVNYKLEF